mmetsp:Transcript_19166/g.38150  ORF Transcript_19166/g.38150 Transcript_19166/m.38150 type:complete len:81 (-) Transcript_19166:631-873(-)
MQCTFLVPTALNQKVDTSDTNIFDTTRISPCAPPFYFPTTPSMVPVGGCFQAIPWRPLPMVTRGGGAAPERAARVAELRS